MYLRQEMPETSTWVYEILIKRAASTLIFQIDPVFCEVEKGKVVKKDSLWSKAWPTWTVLWWRCRWMLRPLHASSSPQTGDDLWSELCWLCPGPPLGVPGCLSSASVVCSSLECPFLVYAFFQGAICNSCIFASWFRERLHKAATAAL